MPAVMHPPVMLTEVDRVSVTTVVDNYIDVLRADDRVARRFGIHSAMSAAEALRRCPHAVFLRPRHALYRQYSRVVWDTVSELVQALNGVVRQNRIPELPYIWTEVR